ncbi:MAG: hypothetical protein IKY90_00540 [Oscillospiraceae bacterium]|nr:hypothetical protein [Oscillospiraceae bacterium]
MKKLIIFILATTLLFTACSQRETTAQLEKPAKIEVSSFTNEKTGTNEKRSEFISSITVGNMLSENRLSVLKAAGFDVGITNVEENADSTLTITLSVTNGKGRTLLLPVTAMLDYNSYGDGFHGEKLYWGSINVQDNELVLTTLNAVYLVDTGKMKLKETVFDTGSLSDSKFYLGDTIKKDDDYITCFYGPEADNGFLVFNPDGSLKQLVETDYNFFGRTSNPSEYEPYALELDAKTELFFINKEETLIAERDYFGGSYACDLQTGDFVYYRKKLNAAVDGGRVALISMEQPRTLEDCGQVAILYDENGRITDSFLTSVKLHYSFDEPYYLESENLSLEISETANKVYTIYHPYAAQQLVLDFNTQTAHAEYIYDQRWNYEVWETSADGKISIVTGSRYGVGDVSYEANVLLENSTGKMKYIGETGGMYGGRNETGFFQNGDVYFYDYDAFNIFDTDMEKAEPIWQLTDYFPLGDNVASGVSYRYLMAARRDPQDKSVSIIYFDYPYVEDSRSAYIDYEKDDMQLKATYHFARISADGKVEFDYDTGVNVLLGFNLIQVSIYPENNGNMHFYGWSQSHQYIWFEGSINPYTGVYTPIKEFDNTNS